MSPTLLLYTLGFVSAVLLLLLLVERLRSARLRRVVATRDAELAAAGDQATSAYTSARAGLVEARRLADQQVAEIAADHDRIKQHYEKEARRIHDEAAATIEQMRVELTGLRKYDSLNATEAETRQLLADAIQQATALRSEAQELIERTRAATAEQRQEAAARLRQIEAQADAILDQATRDAGRMVASAHQQAEQIAGDAYRALREHETLDQAVKAIRNVVDGYGDRYIIPTRSLVDDLAADFGHTEAGRSLAAARAQSRRMVEEGQAADCDYAEPNRRQTAIRFVIDAFNGRVDAILSRTTHDNHGTLEQEIRDAFSLVNLNGAAFRNARILPAYLETRIAELKWAVVAQELRQKEREEQRRIKEQMREEEKARREYERAIKEAEQEEIAIKKALEKARLEADQASAQERAALEGQIALLNQKLAEAEAKNQRAVSMAQQTRKGNVYIVSNLGSFGEQVFKIGMTRRLEPMDRIWELSDASVPFDFDVHAMIASDDAPKLEAALHSELEDLRINKVNYRKEFFRVPLERVRSFLTDRGIEASYTMLADAHEYRETEVLNRMTPDEREKYHIQKAQAQQNSRG